MARNRALRPIDETRGPHGQLTSETAARLLRMRGGYARAQQMRQDGFKSLAYARVISALVRRAKSIERASCNHCKPFHSSVLEAIAALRAQHYAPITRTDAQLLD
jgi:hypothetical protein